MGAVILWALSMKLTLLILATAFSTSWALTCKKCDELSSTKCSNPADQVCTATTGQLSCYTTWIVNNDGTETVQSKGCSSSRIDYDEPQEQCSLSDSRGVYDSGTCNCAGDRCNAEKPTILTSTDKRLKCYHCPYASGANKLACSKQDRDWTNLGVEITCPKGVRYCNIKTEGAESFYRGCDSELYDDIDDNDGYMGLGKCESSSCSCGQNKCNTGFHGVKCHSYVHSDCGSSTTIGAGTVQCLSGIGSCGVVKAEFQDFCHEYVYNCGFGRNSSGCETGKNLAGVVDEAEVCYCDATGGDDLCDPTNSGTILASSFALILAVTLFAFK